MNQAAKTRIVNSSRAKHTRRVAEAAMRLSKRRMWLEQLEDRAMMTTFNVSASVADGAAGSLRAALTAANSNGQNDTIILAAGTYVLTSSLSVSEYTKSVTFQGDTAGNTIIDANNTGRVFDIGYGVTASFNDLTIKNGGSSGTRPTGAGINGYVSTIVIDDCIIEDNQGYSGGGVYLTSGGSLTITDSIIRDNDTSRFGGGVYADSATVSISNTEISSNATASGYDGGGLYFSASSVSLMGGTIEDNYSGNDGGGLAIFSGSLAITGGTVSGNETARLGGGLLINAPSSAVGITGITISDNTAASGGGLFRTGGSAAITLTESTVAGNDAPSTNSNYGEGGGIFSYQTFNLVRSTVSGNTSYQNGGGVWGGNAAISFTNSTVSGNSSASGGGLYLSSGNTSSSSVNSTFANNSSSGAGGAFYIGGYSSLALKNTIVSGSTAASGTSADLGGTTSYDINSGGYNLFSLSSISSFITGTTTGNQLGVNAKLGSLANNGGPTYTHALASDSPAIDAATSSGAPSVDQRNTSRTATYDIGAYEYVVTNHSPTATADTGSTSEDSVLNVSASGVLGNDSDADSDSLSVSAYDSKSAKGATVKVNSNGSYSYDPTSAADLQKLHSGKSTTDTFDYTVSDGHGGTASATVTITVSGAEDAPVGIPDSYSTDEDTKLSVSASGVLGNDTDADDGDKSLLTVSLDSGPAHGTLKLNSNGSFDYTPDANYHGSDDFYYTASDGGLSSSTTKVTLTVNSLNDPPTATADTGSTSEDSVLNVSASGVLGNDSDVDGDSPLTVSAYDSKSTKGTVKVNSNGSYSYDPTGVSDFQKLHSGKSTTDTFDYTVSDGHGGTASTTVTVTVNGAEDAPVGVPDSYSTDEDTKLSVSASGVLGNDTDADDGDKSLLTVTVDTGPSHGTLKLNSDGSFDYTPDANYHGPDVFYYTASDGGLSSSSTKVSLTVNSVNDPPTVACKLDDVEVDENSEPSEYSLTGVFADLDGDTLTYTIEDNDNTSLVTAAIVSGKLVLTYAANSFGEAEVTVRATDPDSAYADMVVGVTVNKVNNTPTVADPMFDLLVVTDAPVSHLSLDAVFDDADFDTHGDTLTYTATSGDTDLAIATIVNGQVQLTYVAEAFGVTDVTVRATDSDGAYVEDVFKLTVGDSSQQEGEPSWGGDGGGGSRFATFAITGGTGGTGGGPPSGCPCEDLNEDGKPDCPGCTNTSVLGLIKQGIDAFASFYAGAVGSLFTDSSTNPHPILSFNFILPETGDVPETVEAQITMGSVVTTPVFYDTSSLDNGDKIRVNLLVDATELRTGDYEYTVDFTMHFADTSTETKSYSNHYQIFNWAESPFGNRWWLADLDRLDVNGDGAAWLQGTADSVRFTDDGVGGYESPAGSFSRLETLSNGWYTVISPHGEQTLFDDLGLMRMRQDRNGNSTYYAYYDVNEDDFADEIAFITDEFGRTTDFHYNEDGLVDAIADFTGRKTTFDYVDGRLVSVTGPDPDGSGPLDAPVVEFEHTEVGLIDTVTDPLGNVTTYDYDPYSRRLTGGTNPDGGEWSVDPQIVQGLVDPTFATSTSPAAPTLASDAIASFTDPNDHTTFSTFDRHGNPLTREDADSNHYSWVRDEHGRATEWTLPDPDGEGPLEELVYSGTCDVCGNRDYILYPDGGEEHWTYEHTFNQMTSHTDQMGRLTKFDIDEENGNLLAIRRIVGDEDDEINEETDDILYGFTYTDDSGDLPAGLLLTETDPLGRVTEYGYDDDPESPSFGRLIFVTMASGTDDESTTQYEYDLAGNVTATIDPLGRRTEMEYDALDRLITIIGADPDGPSNPLTSPITSFTYDAIGRLLTSTDSLGHVTTFDFDDEENTQTITLPDPDGAGPLTAPTTVTQLDLAGNLTKLTDPLGRITEFGFDKLDRPETVTLPDPDGAGELTSPVQSTTYDNIGNIATTTDANGNTTAFRYDEMSRLIEMTLPDPDGEGPLDAPVYGYTYFLDGQLKTSTDPLGRVTTYDYDEDLGWLISVTQPDPDGEGPLAVPVTLYEHDAVGNVTKVTEPGGAYTSYKFDNLDRVVEATAPDPDGAGPLTSPVTTFVYDEASQLTSVIDPLGRTTSYGHDDLGRQTSVTLPDPDGEGELESPVWIYTFDAVDRLVTTTDPLGNITTYAYDNLDRLISVTEPDPDGAGSLTAPVTSFTYNAASELLTITDPLGRVTTYAHDGLGRQSSITLPDPDGAGPLTSPITTFGYDAASNLITVTDPLGNITTNTYDFLNRRIGVTLPDPDGEGELTSPVYSYAFNAASELVSVTDPLSRVTAYTYDALSRIDTLTLPDPDDGGSQTSPVYSYTYNDALNLVAETDPLSNVTAYAYDYLHRRIGVTEADPDGEGELESPVWTYAFDAASQLISQTDPLSRVTAYGYDGLGRTTTLTQPDPDGAGELTSPVWSYSYDAANNLKTVTDPLSRVTTYDYDHLHRQTQVTLPDPDGVGMLTSPVWNYAYDAASQLLSQTDPLNRLTSYTYDGLGRLSTLTQPDPDDAGPLTSPVTTFAYDAASNVTQMTDARGYVTAYAYDNLYRRTSVTLPDPDGGGAQSSPVWNYSYDAANQLLSQTDPMSRTTAFTFDNLGRTIAVTQPDPDGEGLLTAPVTAYGYDPVGNLLTVTDPLSHVTTYAYDNLYRRTSITDALSGVTSFTFDAAGQLLTLTDPVANTTTWAYDDLGRVTQETNQLDKSRYFQYDAVGNLTQRTDRNGRVIQYAYDGLNRNTDENWYEDSTLVHNINFDFDAANQLLSAEDTFATNQFTYDKLGRVTQEVQTLAGFADTITLDQEFDPLGDRTHADMNYGTSATLATDYVYDGLSRMTQQTQYDSTTSDIAWKRVSFQYNAASQFSQIDRFVGNSTTPIAVATTTYDYDGIGRLQSLQHFTDTTTWAGYDYEYDASSRITAIDSFVDGLTEYDYDDTNQLTAADHTGIPDEAYDYDANGNRDMSGYVIGDNNQLESDGSYNYEYDDEGNRISRMSISTGYVTTYTWDHRNRLTAVTEFDDQENVLSTVEYTYDAFDRWISRTYDADGPGGADAVDTFFAQDGDQVALEFEAESGTVDGDDLTHVYSWGPAIDQLLADEAFGEEPLWALDDHLGTPGDLVAHDEISEETELRNHRLFDSYGNLEGQTSTVFVTSIDFTSRIGDVASGQINVRARWYDASTGQWLSQDPITFGGGDQNLQRYVSNAVTTFVDPLGLLQSTPGATIVQQNNGVVRTTYGTTVGFEVAPGLIKINEELGGGYAYFDVIQNNYEDWMRRIKSWNSGVTPQPLQWAINMSRRQDLQYREWEMESSPPKEKYAEYNDFKANFLEKALGKTLKDEQRRTWEQGCVGLASVRLGLTLHSYPSSITGAIAFENEAIARVELAKRPGWFLFAVQLSSSVPFRPHEEILPDPDPARHEPNRDPSKPPTPVPTYATFPTIPGAFDPRRLNLGYDFNFAFWVTEPNGGQHWEWMNHSWADPASRATACVKHSESLPSHGKTFFVIAPRGGSSPSRLHPTGPTNGPLK